ncbi:MAG: arylesterase [Acidobacteriota bacterium]
MVLVTLSTVLIAVLLLCHGFGHAAERGSLEGSIVAFGDSLTEGYGVYESEAYPAILERSLMAEGHRYRVVNEGISGETSGGALARVGRIAALRPDIVILETGANDAFQNVPPERIEQNISRIIRTLDERGIVVVLAGMLMSEELIGRRHAEAFGRIYPRLAEEHGAVLIPFFLKGVAGRRELNFADGVHPNAAGYRIVAETVRPYAIEAMERLGKPRSRP